MNRHLFKYRQNNCFFRILGKVFSNGLILQFRRFLYRYLPFLRMESHATDTVYMSWLVDIEKVQDRFPPNVKLWEKNGKTIFSILFYQHHHFGLHCFKKARRLFPSPKQSNWRFYLAEDIISNGVIFEQIVVDNLLYVIGGRLLSDEMPAQYDPSLQHRVQKKLPESQAECSDMSEMAINIEASISIDDLYRLDVSLIQKGDHDIPASWKLFFKSWHEALTYFVPKTHVWVECVDDPKKLSQANIQVDTDFNTIKSLKIKTIECPLLREFGITKEDEVLCLFIPHLDFHVLDEVPLKFQ